MRVLLCLCFLLLACPAFASEPAVDTLPPELVRLRDEGRLTVRALWAWKLVPESTADAAMALRSQGLDLIGADRAQLAAWLREADEGRLDLSQEQRGVVEDLIRRMDEGTSVEAPPGSGVSDAENPPAAEVAVAQWAADPSEALAALDAQSEAGSPEAKVALALAAMSGFDGSPDPVRAVGLLEEAAAAGDANAMALLADEYESGLWVQRDAEKAGQLRRKAAEAGSKLAQWGLE